MPWYRHLYANVGWKLVSVLLAVLVWLLVHYNLAEGQQAQRRRVFDAVPIAVLQAPDDTRGFRLEPAAVRVTVSGSAARVAGIVPGDLLVFVNLAGPGPAPTRAEVEVHLPPGLTVVSLSPMQVRVAPLPGPET